MKILVLCLSFFVSAIASAEVWVTGAGAPLSQSQEAALTADYLKHQSRAQVIPAFRGLSLLEIPSSEIEKIRKLLDDGENAFFANKFASAEKYLSQALLKIRAHSYRGLVSKFIALAEIRLAQTIEAQHRNADAHWSNAVISFPKLKLSPSEYSPSTREKWKKTLARLNQKTASLTVRLPQKGFIFLNGLKKAEKTFEESFSLPIGIHHIAVLIPGANWWIKTVELNEYSLEQVASIPLVQGNCQNPEYKGPILPKGVIMAAFFEDGCIREYRYSRWEPQELKLSHLQPSFQSSVNQALAEPVEKESWLSKKVKSPWFWVIAGVVAGGAYAYYKYENEKPEERVVPVHTGN